MAKKHVLPESDRVVDDLPADGEYPRMLYGPEGQTIVVQDSEDEADKKRRGNWTNDPQVPPSSYRHIQGKQVPG